MLNDFVVLHKLLSFLRQIDQFGPPPQKTVRKLCILLEPDIKCSNLFIYLFDIWQSDTSENQSFLAFLFLEITNCWKFAY
jgi:hypothetical protein